MRTRLISWIVTIGAAGVLAGALLLPLSLLADLRSHDHDHAELLEQLPPSSAALVEESQAHENASPWHDALVAGEALLVTGLGALYLAERARNRRLSGAPRQQAVRPADAAVPNVSAPPIGARPESA